MKSTRLRRLGLWLMLISLAYLGFYFYGLILGVFAPSELIGFTVIAAVAVVGNVLVWLRERFATPEIDETGEDARELHKYREHRGF